MTDNALVSVAIITYNQKEFIKECLESVLDQDYSTIEIIVADDGSTDGTQEILKEYEQKFHNIKCLLANTNRGITVNSNIAHFACTGKYIAWMGGDDLMLQGKIKKQVEFMENHPECSICYHNLEVFDSDSGDILFLSGDKSIPYEGGIKLMVKHGTFNGACSSMVRRSSTSKNGFDDRIPIASDWLYWIETLLDGGQINYINEIMGRYRMHSNNISKVDNFGNFYDHLMTCSIVLSKYPFLRKEAYFRLSRIFRRLAKMNTKYYIHYLLISLKYKIYLKNIFSIIIYYSSIKKIKI